MADYQRKLLEELMGSAAMGIERPSDFKDSKVCRSYLCGLCPYDLFTNTKMDIGECDKQHVDTLKKEYETAYKRGNVDFQREWLYTLRDFVASCDKKIRSAQARLDKNPEDRRATELFSAIGDLSVEISTLNSQVEGLGEEGRVLEALVAYKKADELQLAKSVKEAELVTITGGAGTQQQKLRVCEICSALLSVYDSDRRLADHFGGKMHMGYVKIRDQVKELEDALGSYGGGGADTAGTGANAAWNDRSNSNNGSSGGNWARDRGSDRDGGSRGGGGGGRYNRSDNDRRNGSGYGGGYGGGRRNSGRERSRSPQSRRRY